MSDQNEIESNENQEEEVQDQEIGILQVEACCDNGCILTDDVNGCSVAEGTGNTASGFASHAEGIGNTASEELLMWREVDRLNSAICLT